MAGVIVLVLGAPQLSRVGLSHLKVTHGSVAELPSGRLALRDAKVRFVAPGTADAASVNLAYEGPPAKIAPLQSGALRQQFGLKLRAKDGCNLLYVMWRLAPDSEIVVSTKNNPGQTTFAQCKTNGYANLKPTRRAALPAFTAGASHTLAASVDGAQLTVRVDDKVVWEGRLTPQALAVDGPTGVRTDNVTGTLSFSAAPSADAAASPGSYEDGD